MTARMSLEEAKAFRAKAEAKRLKQQAYNKKKREEERALLAEANEVIAAAERAAKANGYA
jgi:hypothetical protein